MSFLQARLGSPRAEPQHHQQQTEAQKQEEQAAFLAAKAEEERRAARDLGRSLGQNHSSLNSQGAQGMDTRPGARSRSRDKDKDKDKKETNTARTAT